MKQQCEYPERSVLFADFDPDKDAERHARKEKRAVKKQPFPFLFKQAKEVVFQKKKVIRQKIHSGSFHRKAYANFQADM